jgi:hypothetical protein
METDMTTLLTRRAFFRRSATLGAGLVAASALPILPARAAIPAAIYTIQQQSSGRFLDAWQRQQRLQRRHPSWPQ